MERGRRIRRLEKQGEEASDEDKGSLHGFSHHHNDDDQQHRAHDDGDRLFRITTRKTTAPLLKSVILLSLMNMLPLVVVVVPTTEAWISSSLLSPNPRHFKTTTSTTLFQQQTEASSFESMTVKELRQLMEDSGHNQRGLQSRLKRKQDIIDFLIDKQHGGGEETDGDDDEDHDDYEYDYNSEINDNGDLGFEIDDDDISVLRENEAAVVKKPSKEKNTKDNRNGDNNENDDASSQLDISESIKSLIPPRLKKSMVNRDLISLLPSQALSFERIQQGRDTVLQAPTGSGKTLAYVLPLLSRKYGRRPKPKKGVACPFIVVIAPSRELARQVGKEWKKFTDLPVTTVFGGVPIERHIALLKYKPFVLVSTPGRLRELVRSDYVDYSEVRTLVLDEADTLLDTADSPDVYAIFKDIESSIEHRDHDNDEYQLVLVSATINNNVQDFTDDLEISPRAYIRIQGNDSKVLVSSANKPKHITETAVGGGTGSSTGDGVPYTVQHWHVACKSMIRPDITSDLISILKPRLTIIFVPTKSETEMVASYLRMKNQLSLGDIHSLHGDMSQTLRSRTIAKIREMATKNSAATAGDASQILVATDVASRGLDLPNVDLVIQYGIPRDAGKDGTFSTELYTHRTGRTGRVVIRRGQGQEEETARGGAGANAILLYDPVVGEGKVLPDLISEVQKELKVAIQPKPIPSVSEVVEAGYQRSKEVFLGGHGGEENPSELIQYFVSKLEQEHGLDTNNPHQLLQSLAQVMASLSNLDSSLSPYYPQYSLLTRSPNDRTLRLRKTDRSSLTPPEVTKYCKSLGSGKLGRVTISDEDGSALFDLPEKRAKRLLAAVADTADNGGDNTLYELEMPTSLDPQ